MLKKTVTFIDYNGTERTEDKYFNFTEAELIELETEFDGGLSSFIEKISKSTNQKEIIQIVKMIIVKAYGEKSDDGRRFVKNDKIREDFVSSPAYSKIFMELATNDEAASEFFNKVIPELAADK